MIELNYSFKNPKSCRLGLLVSNSNNKLGLLKTFLEFYYYANNKNSSIKIKMTNSSKSSREIYSK